MDSAIVSGASEAVQEVEDADTVFSVPGLLRHTRVDFFLRPKKMTPHVRRIARGAVGESVGIIVGGFLEKLVGWPLGLDSVLPLDFFCYLSESLELMFVRLVRLFFQLFGSKSLALLRPDCVGLGRGQRRGD